MRRFPWLILLLCSALNTTPFRPIGLTDPGISADSLFQLLTGFNDYPQPERSGGFVCYANQVNDTLSAPFYIYVPDTYRPDRPMPLIVVLHGGVGRPDFRSDITPDGGPDWDFFLSPGQEENWLHLIPLAQHDCMWWRETGIENLLYQIRFVMDNYNVDEDRVWVSGFSDGGSGSFDLALRNPDRFAAFAPLNGMVDVANGETGLGAFPVNLANRPLYVVNTDLDPLYPAALARKTVELVQRAGADIFYKEINGYGHDAAYLPSEIGNIRRFLERHPRNPFRTDLTWECDTPGGCDWLWVDGLDTLRTTADWQVVYQDSLPETRIQFGFMNDPDDKKPGVLVKSVVEGNLPARLCGLIAGDRILKMDGKAVQHIDELTGLKHTKHRGDSFTLEVKRSRKTVVLNGTFPPSSYTPVFLYPRKSGIVKAHYAANTFKLQASRVSRVTLKISPEMVRMNQPIRVVANGREVFYGDVALDRDYMLRDFYLRHVRKALWVNEIVVDIP
jgi:predicted esterase